MIRLDIARNWTERQQLVVGILALLGGTACILTLPATGPGGGLEGPLLALVSVALFVAGTLSIGRSAPR